MQLPLLSFYALDCVFLFFLSIVVVSILIHFFCGNLPLFNRLIINFRPIAIVQMRNIVLFLFEHSYSKEAINKKTTKKRHGFHSNSIHIILEDICSQMTIIIMADNFGGRSAACEICCRLLADKRCAESFFAAKRSEISPRCSRKTSFSSAIYVRVFIGSIGHL